MPDIRKARPAQSTRRIYALLLLAAALVLAPRSDLRAQEADPESEGAAAGAAEEAAEALKLNVQNGYTGKPLDTTTPAPHQGQLGDGRPDMLYYRFHITRHDPADLSPVRSESGEPDLAAALGALGVSLVIADMRGDGPVEERAAVPLFDGYLVGQPRYSAARGRIEQEGYIDLGFDLDAGAVYEFIAILKQNGIPVDTFTTQFTPGNPLLSIQSTVTTAAGGREGMRMTGTITGTSALEMSSDYLRLSGRGRIDYEDFELIPPGSCSASTTWEGDYFWEVLDVVLADSPEEFNASLETVGGFPPPVEVVVALDPNIDETATVRCGIVSVPIPGFKHFFPAFYSAHGDEMDEARMGLVMQGWMPGTGDVIATRTYERAVQVEDATITESTTLELRWPD